MNKLLASQYAALAANHHGLHPVRRFDLMVQMPQIGRDIQQDRGIQADLFCAQCGYNLRTRSVVGRCSECGNNYDARPTKLQGIFLPHEQRVPFADYLRFLACAASGVLLLYHAVEGGHVWACLLGIPLLIMGLMFLRHAVRATVQCVRQRALRRQIQDSADD